MGISDLQGKGRLASNLAVQTCNCNCFLAGKWKGKYSAYCQITLVFVSDDKFDCQLCVYFWLQRHVRRSEKGSTTCTWL